MTNLRIVELVGKLDELLISKYNATIALTGYGEFIETFRTWPIDLQEKIARINDPKILKEFFDRIGTDEADYLDIISIKSLNN